jgi:hypothetical protein
MSISRRRIWARCLALVGLAVLIAQQAWRHGHDYIFADQFATVEPGRIYRGAWQQDWPMRRLVRDYKIKTIVALAHQADHPLAVKERALARELGCRWVHVPIVDDRSTTDGQSVSDQLEQAAAILADPASQPVYFHCHHGLNRTSMAQIAYRTLYCGWTLEQATDEVARTFGLVRADHGPDYRHMTQFYRQRVLPRRAAAQANRPTEATRR